MILNDVFGSVDICALSLNKANLLINMISLPDDKACAIAMYLLMDADALLGIPDRPQNKILIDENQESGGFISMVCNWIQVLNTIIQIVISHID